MINLKKILIKIDEVFFNFKTILILLIKDYCIFFLTLSNYKILLKKGQFLIKQKT